MATTGEDAAARHPVLGFLARLESFESGALVACPCGWFAFGPTRAVQRMNAKHSRSCGHIGSRGAET